MTRKVVVVGYGMVAHHFVSALRERDAAGVFTITVIGEERHAAYDRVGMSRYVRERDVADLLLAPADAAPDPLVDVIVSEQVTHIDLVTKEVTTDADRHVPYDVLVLATGSIPFVPPTPGRELPGCFVYRTLDDLDAIAAHAGALAARAGQAGGAKRHGVVVGGGLLGLEAADALRVLGFDTRVVEAAPRLMPVQVDEGGGHMLRRHITDLGLGVHAGVMTARIEAGPTGVLDRVVLSDESELAADIVVFAAGIRPRDELAKSADLPLGDRGGVLTDRLCRVGDEAVFAIGEVAAVEGRTYGLVAPGYAMAELVAEQLVNGPDAVEPLPEPDMSTKLKLLGVDVASFGDAHGVSEGALCLAWTDQSTGVYKKLVVTDDASTVLGGVLVGDASQFGTLRALVGKKLPVSPEQLVAPSSTSDASLVLPDDAQVCSCHAVKKAHLKVAVAEGGCSDVSCLKKCTKAGTGCGSCVPMLTQILKDSGVATSSALCEHFAASRSDLFEIVRTTGIRRFSELIGAHGTGAGCDICKPAVASMLASLDHGHVLDQEQRPLQDTNDKFLANLQRDGTYSVVPRIPGGEITPEKLIVIGEVARDFDLYTKITGGQRIDLFGARVEQLPAIWRRLVDAGFESGHAYGKALRTVKSCVGSTWCRYGVQDSVGLAIALELRYRGLRAPHKIKAAVSGCARECAEARGKDFGIIATENGWNLYLGGNGGFTPRHAQLFASDLDTNTLVTYIDRFLMYYIRTADRLQRTAPWLESLDGGLDRLREVIIDDVLGVCAELDAAMAVHIGNYADEWAATLDDPEKLRWFNSFVNQPGTPDPDIVFVSERGQPRPPAKAEKVMLDMPVLRTAAGSEDDDGLEAAVADDAMLAFTREPVRS